MENSQLIEKLINRKQLEKDEIADELDFLKSNENVSKFQLVYSVETHKFKHVERERTLEDDEIVVTKENLSEVAKHSI